MKSKERANDKAEPFEGHLHFINSRVQYVNISILQSATLVLKGGKTDNRWMKILQRLE